MLDDLGAREYPEFFQISPDSSFVMYVNRLTAAGGLRELFAVPLDASKGTRKLNAALPDLAGVLYDFVPLAGGRALYRADHKFLLDPIIPRPGGTIANYDLVIASQPYRARAPLDFKAQRVIAPLAKALGPGGRLIAIHSHGNDPGMEIIQKLWPDDNPFIHDRHQIMKAVKHELGPAGRDLNFNAYADNRSLFRYDMHTLPSEISQASSIGTSTLFAAWNAAIYVAQVEDDRLADVVGDGRYLDTTRDVLREHGGLWFFDESYVISRRRE